MIVTGMQAPDFTLPDQNGNLHSLSDYRGKKVVLYFYPKDNTSGCTVEAVGFRDETDNIARHNAVIIGVSKDSVASHIKFAEKYSLPFILLSDTEKIAIEAYDVLKEKKMYGKSVIGVNRSTFVIDEDGVVVYAAYGVKAAGHAEEIAGVLEQKSKE